MVGFFAASFRGHEFCCALPMLLSGRKSRATAQGAPAARAQRLAQDGERLALAPDLAGAARPRDRVRRAASGMRGCSRGCVGGASDVVGHFGKRGVG